MASSELAQPQIEVQTVEGPCLIASEMVVQGEDNKAARVLSFIVCFRALQPKIIACGKC